MPLTKFSATLGWISSILDIFKPTSSPHLVVILFGIAGLITLNLWFGVLPIYNITASNGELTFKFEVASSQNSISLRNEFDYWFVLAVPVATVLYIFTTLTLTQKTNIPARKNGEESERQIKFAYATCISSAVLCLVFGGANLLKDGSKELFFFLYLACIGQIVLFLIYNAVHSTKYELEMKLKHSQIAIVTASLFIGATICMTFINPVPIEKFLLLSPPSIENFSKFFGKIFLDNDGNLGPFTVTAVFFYLLWARYLKFWIQGLFQILKGSNNLNLP